MKNRAMTLSVIGLATLAYAGAATAQEAPPDRPARVRALDVESVMSMRDRLELTEEQVAALNELRAAEVDRRNAQRAEVEEMRSRLRAGMIPRSEMMAFVEERRATRQQTAAERQQRIDEILTSDQRTSLEQMRAERRAFERGRRAGRFEGRARGSRGQRGFERGWTRGFRRGPGFERELRRRQIPGTSGSQSPTDTGPVTNGPSEEPR